MIPLKDENPSRSTPVVMRVIVALNVACFLYEMALGPGLRGFVFEFGFVPARLSLALEGAESPLAPGTTLISSMFLHGGWLHLLGNMWYLWIFGDNIEDRLGHVRFLLFYVLAGLAAATTHWLTNASSGVPTVGASGAIAGVLGGYLIAFPRARVLTLVPLFVFIQVMSLPAIVVLGLWFVFQFFSGALSLGMGATGGVAWWAHVGGFAFGVVFMGLAGGGRRPREIPGFD
jgi:membrane associated rhomboid family serine protease